MNQVAQEKSFRIATKNILIERFFGYFGHSWGFIRRKVILNEKIGDQAESSNSHLWDFFQFLQNFSDYVETNLLFLYELERTSAMFVSEKAWGSFFWDIIAIIDRLCQ